MPPSSASGRKALVTRKIKETKIQLSLSLDGGPLDPLEYNSEFDGHSSILIPPARLRYPRLPNHDHSAYLDMDRYRLFGPYATCMGETRGLEFTASEQRRSIE